MAIVKGIPPTRAEPVTQRLRGRCRIRWATEAVEKKFLSKKRVNISSNIRCVMTKRMIMRYILYVKCITTS